MKNRTMGLISRTADGLYRLPAFIDAHVHVESSHLTPAQFGRLVASHGTLAAICDPHEIVNVMGEAGLDFMLADSRRSPYRVKLTVNDGRADCPQSAAPNPSRTSRLEAGQWSIGSHCMPLSRPLQDILSSCHLVVLR